MVYLRHPLATMCAADCNLRWLIRWVLWGRIKPIFYRFAHAPWLGVTNCRRLHRAGAPNFGAASSVRDDARGAAGSRQPRVE